MSKEMNSIVKKTVKVAGATCIALGGAALKAMTEGAKYLKDTVKKIIDDAPKTEEIVAEAVEADASQESPVATEEAP